MNKLIFREVSFNEVNWQQIESAHRHMVFKTKEWMQFLIETQNIKPLIIYIYQNQDIVAYFVGAKINKIVSIVASPFEGWTTGFQGISTVNELNEAEIHEIYKQLINYLFSHTNCLYFQSTDWHLKVDQMVESKINYKTENYLAVDLTKSDTELYNSFADNCKWTIRKAIKNNLIIRPTEDPETFVKTYYSQLNEVFAKKDRFPTYPVTRVESLVRNLYNSGKILLIEAIEPEGKCIATGIFVGDNKIVHFWGGASYSEYQNLRPNEILFYEAMKYWKERGYEELDLGGGGAYKKKYRPSLSEKVIITVPKYKVLYNLKTFAKKTYYFLEPIKYKITKKIRR